MSLNPICDIQLGPLSGSEKEGKLATLGNLDLDLVLTLTKGLEANSMMAKSVTVLRSFLYSLLLSNKCYLVSIYFLAGIALDLGKTMMNKTHEDLALMESTLWE